MNQTDHMAKGAQIAKEERREIGYGTIRGQSFK